jgi:hypothetical protein
MAGAAQVPKMRPEVTLFPESLPLQGGRNRLVCKVTCNFRANCHAAGGRSSNGNT